MNFIPKIEYTEINTGITKVITFDSPPEGDPFNEEIKIDVKITTSNNGQRQAQYNYSYKNFSLELTFQSETVKQAVEDFFLNHASKLGKFKYYPSSDEAEYFDSELDQKSIKFSRPIPTGTTGVFEYDIKLKLRILL